MRSSSLAIACLLLCSCLPLKGLSQAATAEKFFSGPQLQFARSIESHDWEAGETYLDKGGDINASGSEGITVLYLAACKGDLDSFVWLLRKGANPNLSPSSLPQIYQLCAEASDIRFLTSAVAHGMNLRLAKPGYPDPIKDLIDSRLPIDKFIRYLDQGVDLTFTMPGKRHPVLNAVIQVQYEYAHAMLTREPKLMTSPAVKDSLVHWLESDVVNRGTQPFEQRAKFVEFLRDRFGIEVNLPAGND